MGKSVTTTIPLWTIGLPLAAVLLLALKTLHIIPADAGLVLIAAALLLGATVFSAVHHAETVALKLGEPFGSLLLAVAVTVIEVALIVSMMLSGGPDAARLPRDTAFAAVMIICNGVVGLCCSRRRAPPRAGLPAGGRSGGPGRAGGTGDADAGSAQCGGDTPGPVFSPAQLGSRASPPWCFTAASSSCRPCATATSFCRPAAAARRTRPAPRKARPSSASRC